MSRVVVTFENQGNARQELTALKVERARLTTSIRQTTIRALKEFCEGAFRQFPHIHSFGWVQTSGDLVEEEFYKQVSAIGINEELDDSQRDFTWNGSGYDASDTIYAGLRDIGFEEILDALGTSVSSEGYGSSHVVTASRTVGLTVEDNNLI